MAFSNEDLGRVMVPQKPAAPDNPILSRIERLLREAMAKEPEAPVKSWKFTVSRNARGQIMEIVATAKD